MHVGDAIKALQAWNIQETAEQAFDETAEDYADMNAAQMFTGLDSEGNPIVLMHDYGDFEYYQAVTVAIKEAQGQVTDRVTLRDTGDFYKHLFAYLEGDKILIDVAPGVEYWDNGELKDMIGYKPFGLDEGNTKEFALGPYKVAFLSVSKRLLNIE